MVSIPYFNISLNILVGGTWRPGGGQLYSSMYPADQSLNAEVSTADIKDVEEAVITADVAWRKPNWSGLKPYQRATFLYKISDLIMQKHETLAKMQQRDNGKPISETRILVTSAANTFRYFAACLETMEGQITPPRGDYLSMSIHEPFGVIAAITPWNSPIASEAQKVAPALAAGNSVILKPAESTPLCALELGRICDEALLPNGVLSVLPGKGSIIGNALVKHPNVKKVAFTGSLEIGKNIAKLAAEKIMPVSLELGGKSPNIVFADADSDQAVNGVLYGIFSSSGESCVAGSRVFIERAIYEDFIRKLVTATGKLCIGDPANDNTQIGPLITNEHRINIENYVALGIQEGGRLLIGGHRPIGHSYHKGFFFMPTIIDGLCNDSKVCQEEIFGPILITLPFDNEHDLIHKANDSVFGLAAGIWTRDYKRAYRVARNLESGTIWINSYKNLSISTPFGGWKESGIGREKGRLGIIEYMQQKSIYWGLSDKLMTW